MSKVEIRDVKGHYTEGIFGKDYVAGGYAVFDGDKRISTIHSDRGLAEEAAKLYKKWFNIE
jgi:hypothetical protein